MPTFEELVSDDLESLVSDFVTETVLVGEPPAASGVSLSLSDTSGADTFQIIAADRIFVYGEPRAYHIRLDAAPDSTAAVANTFVVTADVETTAEVRIFSEYRLNIETLVEYLLAEPSVVFEWRGNEIRVERRLASTQFRASGSLVRESILVIYKAPYFKRSDYYQIADANWFRHWDEATWEEPSGSAHVGPLSEKPPG